VATLSITEAARACHVARTTIQRAVKTGRLYDGLARLADRHYRVSATEPPESQHEMHRRGSPTGRRTPLQSGGTSLPEK
jgi:hypothetical protein